LELVQTNSFVGRILIHPSRHHFQFEDHAYAERDVAEIFTMMMVFSHVSHHNCAAIFNASVGFQWEKSTITQTSPNPLTRNSSIELTSEQVHRIFVYHALFRESEETNSPLILSHVGDNDSRLKAAIEARNLKMIESGQSQLRHACRRCEKLIPGNGYNNLGVLFFFNDGKIVLLNI